MKRSEYDAINDILYLKATAEPIPSYGDEQEDGVVVMRSLDEDVVTGLTIFYPRRDTALRELQLRKIGFPIKLQPLIK